MAVRRKRVKFSVDLRAYVLMLSNLPYFFMQQVFWSHDTISLTSASFGYYPSNINRQVVHNVLHDDHTPITINSSGLT